MALTIDCGEGKHDVCSGTITGASYLFPQTADEPPRPCRCDCHGRETLGDLFRDVYDLAEDVAQTVPDEAISERLGRITEEHPERALPGRHTWIEDDPVAGLIDYVLDVDEHGAGVLAMNGQAHLPIPPERVPTLIRQANCPHWQGFRSYDNIPNVRICAACGKVRPDLRAERQTFDTDERKWRDSPKQPRPKPGECDEFRPHPRHEFSYRGVVRECSGAGRTPWDSAENPS